MDLIPVYYAPYSRHKTNTMKTKKKAHKRSKSNTYIQRFAKAPQSTGKKLQLYLNKKDEEGNPIPTHRFKTSFKEPQSGVEELCGLEIEHILKEFNSKNRDIRTSRVDHLVTVFEKDQYVLSPDAISFTKGSGTIQNGQHRLTAFLRWAKKNYPNGRWKDQVLKVLVVHSLPPESQDITDVGKARTLTDIAQINGLIGPKDKIGRQALKLLQTHMTKTVNGNGCKPNKATYKDVCKMFNCSFPETSYADGDEDLTYASVAREFCSLADPRHSSEWPLPKGYLACIYDLACHRDLELAREILFLCTANRIEIKAEGYDDEFSTVKLSAIKKLRADLKDLMLERVSHAGSAFPHHYGRMLTVILKYSEGESCKRIIPRRLCDSKVTYQKLQREGKSEGTQDPSFYWGLIK